MRHGTKVGIVLVVAAALLGVAAALGAIDAVPAIVLGSLAGTLAIPAFVFGRIGKGQARNAARARELQLVGQRVRGVVREALPYPGYHGGLVMHDHGLLLVLRVQIVRPSGIPETVTLHVIEPSEVGRARLGTEVTVVEHPDDPTIRALEGFLPNGWPA